MSTLKCVTILGARPQFIKAAPLNKALIKSNITEVIVHTGQHFDPQMSSIFFEELSLPLPKYSLGISGGTHPHMVGRMLMAIEEILLIEEPRWVIVFGDTNSTLAGALAAAQLNIPLVHIEAGLRSYQNVMPEEKNRKITDHLSQLLFCPTSQAVFNLEREGITEGVFEVGDLMYDLALQVKPIEGLLSQRSLTPKEYDLMTLHRAECCDSSTELQERLTWLTRRSEESGRPLIWPIHPRAHQAIEREGFSHPSLRIIEPVSYREMATLLKGAYEVYTDSGGLQREAYFHQILCTTLRQESEWPETIRSGWNRLWGDRDRAHPPLEERSAPDAFGRGDAAQKIVQRLIQSSIKNQ